METIHPPMEIARKAVMKVWQETRHRIEKVSMR